MAYAFESGSLSAAADCLDRAETTLCQAQSTSAPGQRYVLAHTAALRVAAPCSQLVPVRADPGGCAMRGHCWRRWRRSCPSGVSSSPPRP